MTTVHTDEQIDGWRGALSRVKRWPSSASKDWAHDCLATLSRDGFIDAVVAIGSAVRPIGHANSDVDFLLVFHGRKPRVVRPPIDVDLRVYPQTEVESQIASGNDLLVWAVQYGVLLHESRGYWSAIRHRWDGKLPLPARDVCVERANRASRLAKDLLAVPDVDAALEQAITGLTHVARARLIGAGVHPASRPELAFQLRAIGERSLAGKLSGALAHQLTVKGLVRALSALDEIAAVDKPPNRAHRG